jgi:hypothetical protein
VREGDLEERQRLSVFHECGHFDIPWHRELSYICDCGECDDKKMNKHEKEAFRYASDLLFPRKQFFDDLLNLPISFNSIKQLAYRYLASFEATAIKYITYNPGMCAVLYLTENTSGNALEFPYRVKYSVKSNNFHRYWRPSAVVMHHEDIDKCFREQQTILTEIPATVFGSTKKHSYKAELRPYGPDQICALLNIPVSQISCI